MRAKGSWNSELTSGCKSHQSVRKLPHYPRGNAFSFTNRALWNHLYHLNMIGATRREPNTMTLAFSSCEPSAFCLSIPLRSFLLPPSPIVFGRTLLPPNRIQQFIALFQSCWTEARNQTDLGAGYDDKTPLATPLPNASHACMHACTHANSTPLRNSAVSKYMQPAGRVGIPFENPTRNPNRTGISYVR